MPKNKNGTGRDPQPPSKKLLAAIDAMMSGNAKTQAEAAEIAGMAAESLSRALKKKHVIELIQERVRNQLKTVGVLKATANLERLALQADSEYVQADCTKHILAIAGVRGTADGSRTGGGAGGGIHLNIVLNGQSAAQIGAQDVQSRIIDGQALDINAQTRGGNYLDTVAGGRDEGGEGS